MNWQLTNNYFSYSTLILVEPEWVRGIFGLCRGIQAAKYATASNHQSNQKIEHDSKIWLKLTHQSQPVWSCSALTSSPVLLVLCNWWNIQNQSLVVSFFKNQCSSRLLQSVTCSSIDVPQIVQKSVSDTLCFLKDRLNPALRSLGPYFQVCVHYRWRLTLDQVGWCTLFGQEVADRQQGCSWKLI